ncbi:RagB/SusD family nutrient uptake outer membrane protein [Mucilaginibacter sp. RS28]|uniref:RagB/SusD family nutrient uptake outer membrane protein n=1 Tax=Mucilaginibacter straminoryzae TaxID=2932774 RepID=A0A9X1X201_9SPHI|nr:RagB/SusD family nutrient uptake outer membrane protein [Mucilaginibacter straminoryzae]MCJ8208093.1 RagB/SusD family nutrient uptake outer membrane protein [Mucilaginibacter straminoryzae]
MNRKLFIPIIIMIMLCAGSCKKDWLDQKRDISLVVPTSLSDMRQLLRNSIPQEYECRGITELGAGDYYITTTNYNSLTAQLEKSGYIWKSDLFAGITYLAEWDYSYQQVLTANVVLEALDKLSQTTSNQADYNDVKGEALFMRARAFYNVAQVFTKPYEKTSAGSDLGVPLRQTSDINAVSTRATLQQTYDQITADLQTAASLIKVIPDSRVDPGLAAVSGLLARCYLSMGNYDKALQYSDQSLKTYSKLINYNTLSKTSTRPFTVLNDEVILPGYVNTSLASLKAGVGRIDSVLYASYAADDLRKTLYFLKNTDGTFSFKGQYSGTSLLFGGLATDEMYLIRAECEARTNNLTAALADLNTLMATRFKTGTYTPYTTTDVNAALKTILLERRKELLLRGLRWSDLRRLNKDPQFAATLTKVISGTTYTLLPNDPRYTFPIPEYVIKLSGITQNTY